ncbi:hypothetical protein [Alkalicoccobacillus gibsonii]|uniref:hypothetical protein n=1 Tax=Alkalicoccobacillus gibsonii TaxID=79881 RepID=UPI003514F10F
MELTNIEEQALLALGISQEQYEEYVEQQRDNSPDQQERESTGSIVSLLMNNAESTGALMSMLLMKVSQLEKQVKELRKNA